MPYASISRADLRTRLQDHFSGDPFWTVVEANDALNEALRYWNLFTGFWWGDAQAVTFPGSPFVPVPGSLTWRTRVMPPAGPALTQKSILSLYRSRRGWRAQTVADGGKVPTTIQEWAPIGLGMIVVWPRPMTPTMLRFTGIRLTPVLLNDAQMLDLGEEQIEPILDEALWVLTFKRPSLKDQMEAGHTRFLRACAGMNDRLRRSAYFRKTLGLPGDMRLDRPARANAEREAS